MDEVANILFQLDSIDVNAEGLNAYLDKLLELQKAYRRIGDSSEEANKKIAKVLSRGWSRDENKFGQKQIINSQKWIANLIKATKALEGYGKEDDKQRRKPSFWLPQCKEIETYADVIAVGAAAFANFKAMFAPSQQMYSFLKHISDVNFQIAKLSETTYQSVSVLSSIGGVMKGFGGGAQDYAQFSKSLTLEMQKRNVGMGIGGKWLEALRIYGVQFDERSPRNTLRNITNFISSNKHSDAEKMHLKEILGLPDAMFMAMKKGWASFLQDEARSKKNSEYAEEAAEASKKLTHESAYLSKAWEDLKNKILVVFTPYALQAVNALEKFVNVLKECPTWGIKLMGAFAVAAGAAVSLKAGLGFLRNALSFLGFFGKGSAAGGAAAAAAGSAAGGAAPAAAAAGRAVSAASGIAGGVVGAVANVAGVVVGGVQRQIQIHSLAKLELIVERWQQQWYAYTFLSATGDTKLGRRVRDRFNNELGMEINFLNAAMNRGQVMRNQNTVNEEFYNRLRNNATVNSMPQSDSQSGGQGSTVSVEKIELVVNSSAATAGDVAQEVRQVILNEFMVLGESSGYKN